VARERELDAISSFLDPDVTGGRALILDGEAGIGKTTLWRVGTEIARKRGFRVLVSSASESETQLAYTTLRDLVADAFDDVAEELPPPQRHALAVVLLREDPTEDPLEPATVAVATLTTLQLLNMRSPILLAIDDFQWSDPASTDVISYVLRRLGSTRVHAWLAHRRRAGGEPPPDLPRLEVGPVSVGALGRIIGDRLGVAYSRRTLQRIHEMSEGNIFHALEIARTIGDPTSLPVTGDLPVPPSLLELVKERLAALPAATFQSLAVTSALSRPTLAVLGAALDEDPIPSLDAAVELEIIRIDGSNVSFVHPLIAASAYELAGYRRPAIHGRLAQVVVDVEERARHLVRAEVEPGASVAEIVEEGAVAAAARGAPAVAADLAEAAARLTPPDDPSEAMRRRLDAADWQIFAGDLRGARILLEPLVGQSEPGPDRARVLSLLAATMDPAEALPVLDQALREAAEEVELVALIQLQLAIYLMINHGPREGLAAASRAAELAEQIGDSRLVEAARGEQLIQAAVAGSPVDPTTVRGMIDQDRSYRDSYPPALSAGFWLMCRDRLDEARRVLEGFMSRATSRGDDSAVAHALLHLVELECRAGRYGVAAERADELMAISLAGLDQELAAALYAEALADAFRGRVDESRQAGERGIELSTNVADPIFEIQNEAVLGFLDLSLGDPRAAADRLVPLWPRLVEQGYGEPSVFPVLPNAIHSLLETGDRDESEALLRQLEERGRTLDSAWALSQAARLRALVAAGEGRIDDASRLFDEAMLQHERMAGPFERGRTLLARGSTLRRARRRRDARETLSEALAIFDELGTPLWSVKTRAELGRIGGRTPSGDLLTSSERRVAELVAEGNTNKEVAAILVVSDRTVESSLTQIYRKLGVRSRTELARELTRSD
jgi:DNA-binding CsgD family transcriptional regulator